MGKFAVKVNIDEVIRIAGETVSLIEHQFSEGSDSRVAVLAGLMSLKLAQLMWKKVISKHYGLLFYPEDEAELDAELGRLNVEVKPELGVNENN